MTFRPPYDPEQKARERHDRIAHQTPPANRLHVGRYGGEVKPMAAKSQTFRSEKWLAAVRSLGQCVRCGAPGTEAAHRNESKGMGLKGCDAASAALCRICHREIDQGASMTREERRAEMDRCIVLTLIALASAGKVMAV